MCESRCVSFRDANNLPVHICFGPPTYEIKAGGRIFGFVLPRFCGLVRVDRKTGDELTAEPPKAFWDAIERWEKGGCKMDGHTCVVPRWCAKCRKSGMVDDPAISAAAHSKRGRLVMTCPSCEGKGIVHA